MRSYHVYFNLPAEVFISEVIKVRFFINSDLPSGDVFTKTFPSTVHTPSTNTSAFLSLASFTSFRRFTVRFSLMKMRSDATLAAAEALGNSCDILTFFNCTLFLYSALFTLWLINLAIIGDDFFPFYTVADVYVLRFNLHV